MCVADLNASVLSCNHRWYHLSRPCSPGTNFTNCTRRIALEGWEIKCDFCPFCADWPVDSAEFLLLGGSGARDHRNNSAASANSTSGPLSRTGSMSTPVSEARRNSKVSIHRTISAPLSASPASPVWNASARNRGMAARVDSYINGFHERGAGPVGAQRTRSGSGDTSSTVSDNDAASSRRTLSSAGEGETDSVRDLPAVKRNVSRGWQKAMRKSRDLSSFFK